MLKDSFHGIFRLSIGSFTLLNHHIVALSFGSIISSITRCVGDPFALFSRFAVSMFPPKGDTGLLFAVPPMAYDIWSMNGMSKSSRFGYTRTLTNSCFSRLTMCLITADNVPSYFPRLCPPKQGFKAISSCGGERNPYLFIIKINSCLIYGRLIKISSDNSIFFMHTIFGLKELEGS